MSNQFYEMVASITAPKAQQEIQFLVFEGNGEFIVATPATLDGVREFFEKYERDIEDYDITPVYSPAVHIELHRPSASVYGL